LIRLEDVKMHFPVQRGLFRTTEVKAVDGVSLSIERGETLALVGESGSGKTTVGRLTLRLLKPTAGRVFFDGKEITDLDERRLKTFRKQMQAVFQDPYSSIDPFMNLYQIVEEPLLIHRIGDEKERREHVYKTLEEVRMTPPQDVGEKYPHMMSGGQRQRVGIARSLVLDPKYIMADEPVSMIDASSRIEILRLMKRLQEAHRIAFLYITHDIATAKYFSDRVAVMFRGRIVESGPSKKVIDNPLHPYTKQLIASVPEPDPSNRFRVRGEASEDLEGMRGEELVEAERDHLVAGFKSED
jgi:peptide/nickel transport system ATP-binding protein